MIEMLEMKINNEARREARNGFIDSLLRTGGPDMPRKDAEQIVDVGMHAVDEALRTIMRLVDALPNHLRLPAALIAMRGVEQMGQRAAEAIVDTALDDAVDKVLGDAENAAPERGDHMREIEAYFREHGIVPPEGSSLVCKVPGPDGELCDCTECDTIRAVQARPGVLSYTMPSGLMVSIIPASMAAQLVEDGVVAFEATMAFSPRTKH